jgi:hypothetical protein
MFHTFDSEVAEMFHDANIATLFQNLCYWILHNKTNDKNRREIKIDGILVERYFTFNSIQAFLRQFPYFSKKQIETYLNKLKERGLIVKGNFNEKGFDRTSWYCLVDEQYWVQKYLGETKRETPSRTASSSTPSETNTKPQPTEDVDSSEQRNDTEHTHSVDEFEDPEAEIRDGGEESNVNLHSFHFPKRGNAFLQTGKSISPNGEMHFSKTGNPFPQTGKPIPDINTYPKPNHKQNTASALRSTLQRLDPTLILDSEFYPAAADFLNLHDVGEEYVVWFYQHLKASKRITNFPGYFFTVFFREVYIQRYVTQCETQRKALDDRKPTLRGYICPVCGNQEQITSEARCCVLCETPIDPPKEDIPRFVILYRMDDATRRQYLTARSQAFRSGGNVTEKLKELDYQYGIVS